MTAIASPNWLAIGAALFALCGTGFVVRALLAGSMLSTAAEGKDRDDARRRICLMTGGPLLATGFLLSALSGLASAGLSPFMVALLLGLAFLLLLFVCLEDSLVDALVVDQPAVSRPARLALLAPVAVEPTVVVPDPSAIQVTPIEAAG